MTLPLLKPVNRRRFSPEFKRQLIEQCQPGISVAGVAMKHSINPNLLHRWIRINHSDTTSAQTSVEASEQSKKASISQTVKFIPLTLDRNTPEPQSESQLPNSMIEITLTGKTGDVSLRWPVSAASVLAPLLATLLA
jgi:transposase